MTDDSLRVAVIVASVGRADCLRHLMPALANQTHLPNQVVLSVTAPSDVGFDPAQALPKGVAAEVLIAEKGLPSQRNAGLERVVGDCDIVVFFDDDFVPSRFALEGLCRAFSQMQDVNGMTGHVIADGIHHEGYDEDQADTLVADYDATLGPDVLRHDLQVLEGDLVGLYGCNMAYRAAAIGDTRFDEVLPLYAWQEDVDFAARIPGRRIKTNAFAGVHRGYKAQRETSGQRLGYSQIVNPYYLWRKGSLPARFAGRLALRNFAANHLKQFRPEPWIDRRGRMRGNWKGLKDILVGSPDPRRILDQDF